MLVQANESDAAKRSVAFQAVDATDGMTPEINEAGGQPQISVNSGAWTDTGIGVLSAIGNGRYSAELTQATVQTAGTRIRTRYKSDNTAECPGESVQVVGFDPDAAVYHADIYLTVDDSNSQDEYTIVWFKNGIRISSGITSPTIQVVKRSDGTDLIAETALAEIGSTHTFKKDESTNRMTAGEAAVVIVGATIDSAARSFTKVVGRDSG